MSARTNRNVSSATGQRELFARSCGFQSSRRLVLLRAGVLLTWCLAVLGVACIAGCGGGEQEAAPEAKAPAPARPKPAKQKPKPAPKEQAAEEEAPLPEDFAEWKIDAYQRAKREGNPRILEAIAYVDQNFSGTPNAEPAAQLLGELLKPTVAGEGEELVEPRGARSGRGGPGGPGYPGGFPGSSDPGAAAAMLGSPGSGAPAMGSGYPTGQYEEGEEEGDLGSMGYSEGEGEEEEEGRDLMFAEEGDEEGMDEEGMEEGESQQGMGLGALGSGAPGGRRPRQPQKKQVYKASPELIRAIVSALGHNGSNLARALLKQLVEGTFQTDDNPVATVAALGALVENLDSQNEAVLLSALTGPEKLRPLGQPAGGGRAEAGKMTAEQLQKTAFDLVAPVATEGLRVQLARHIANPQTPREDLALFGKYLLRFDPHNVAAQKTLYFAPAIDAGTKKTIEEYFVAYSSEALAHLLGVPAQPLQRRSPRRRTPGGPEGYPGASEMFPGMGQEEGEHPGAADQMRSGGSEMMYSGAMEEEGEEGEEEMDQMRSGYPGSGQYEGEEENEQEMMPGAGGYPGASGHPGFSQPGMSGSPPGAGRGPGGPGAIPVDSSRPSRYGSAQGPQRPSRRGGPGRPSPEPAGPDPNLPYQMARQLWDAQLSTAVIQRLEQAGSLEAATAPLRLASTMPLNGTRAAVAQLLASHWQDGPKGFESAGVIDQVVTDPALLVLVKALPRKAPKSETTRSPRTRPGGATGRYGPGGQYGPGGDREGGPGMEGFAGEEGYEGMMGPRPTRRPAAGAAHRAEAGSGKTDPREAWMLTSEDMVRTWCERLFAAAQSGAGSPAAEGGIPFPLHPHAERIAEYHLDWPASVAEKLAGISADPLTVHFVRTQQRARQSIVRGFYERKLSSPAVRDLPDGMWLESRRELPDSDLQRSIDVVITTTENLANKTRTDEIDWTVDVLVIDVKRFASAAAAE